MATEGLDGSAPLAEPTNPLEPVAVGETAVDAGELQDVLDNAEPAPGPADPLSGQMTHGLDSVGTPSKETNRGAPYNLCPCASTAVDALQDLASGSQVDTAEGAEKSFQRSRPLLP